MVHAPSVHNYWGLGKLNGSAAHKIEGLSNLSVRGGIQTNTDVLVGSVLLYGTDNLPHLDKDVVNTSLAALSDKLQCERHDDSYTALNITMGFMQHSAITDFKCIHLSISQSIHPFMHSSIPTWPTPTWLTYNKPTLTYHPPIVCLSVQQSIYLYKELKVLGLKKYLNCMCRLCIFSQDESPLTVLMWSPTTDEAS